MVILKRLQCPLKNKKRNGQDTSMDWSMLALRERYLVSLNLLMSVDSTRTSRFPLNSGDLENGSIKPWNF